jgi:hypothetical protein
MRRTPYRIYVAGPYTADSIMGVAANIRRGRDLATMLLADGFSPFAPWNDWELAVRAEIPKENFQVCSMEWLKVAHAVLLVEGGESSVGTLAEIEEAKRLNIPVFEDYLELLEWARNVDPNAMAVREMAKTF